MPARQPIPRQTVLALVVGALLAAAVPTAAANDRTGSARRLPWVGLERPTRPAPEVLAPYAVRLSETRTAPSSGTVRPHAEYEPMAGVLFQFDRWGWPNLVTDMVAALTSDPTDDEIAWVLVASAMQQRRAEQLFESAGADLSKVRFLEIPTETIWIRDWGPQFVWLDETLAIVDNRYFTVRPGDNFVPRLLAEDFLITPVYETGLFHFGGNFLATADRQGFVTSIVNGANAAFGEARVAEIFGEFHGIDTLHVFPALPSVVDATGHIDMWFQLADADTAVISQFLPGSDPAAIAITDNAADYMTQLGYEVFRVPAHNGSHPWQADTHFTYTNAFRVNDKILVPIYGEGNASHAERDAEALAAWQQAAPGAQIVPVDAWDIVYAYGTLHCAVMQVPRYVPADPSASVISPAGGEQLVPAATETIEWSATDDESVEAVDLLLSTDGGQSWVPVAAGLPHTRRHDWIVPDEPGDAARIKAVVHDAAGGFDEAISAGDFSIVDASRHIYDFSSGAGLVHRAWGHHVAGWGDVAGLRLPAVLSSELSASDYLALSASDATGDDSDTNRFVSPVPPTGSSAALVFELTLEEPPALTLEIAVSWEGYGDSCQQLELYVWDRITGDWCDGAGRCGQKSFLDVTSGNRDVTMRGFLRQDLDRLVDAEGRFTLLALAVSTGEEVFHDALAVTLTYVADLDADGDSVPDALDCAPADGATWAPPGEATGLHPSMDGAETRLDWNAPADLGGQSVVYDVLASASSGSFAGATCVASATAATSAPDAEPLSPGGFRSYLVRAVNDCGPGTLGENSAGVSRSAPACP